MESRLARILLKLGTVATLLFLYIPLVVVTLYAFSGSIGQTWPIEDFTLKWFGMPGARPMCARLWATPSPSHRSPP
jgi:ABC-type spermidine/putrescine transport system permease subunit II